MNNRILDNGDIFYNGKLYTAEEFVEETAHEFASMIKEVKQCKIYRDNGSIDIPASVKNLMATKKPNKRKNKIK